MAERNKIDHIVFDKDIYPRDKWNTHAISILADALKSGAAFPPIILETGTNRLLDGMHRWKAHQAYLEEYREHEAQRTLEGIELDGWAPITDEIAVEYQTIPEGIPAKLFATHFSVKHGTSIPVARRKATAREVFTDNPDFTLETLARYLGVSKSRAGDYVSDIRARRREQQKMVAYRLHRLGWTYEEIGEVIGLAKSNVSNICSEFPELEKQNKNLLKQDPPLPHLDIAERFNMPLILVWAIDLSGLTDSRRMERIGIKVQPYDVWNFSKCNDLLGSPYPGRIPGELVAHVLYFFTEPGECIVDPMAGSGTTNDVCLAMGRKCYSYDMDMRHQRTDIIQHDLKDGWPERIKKANLIFWDPPYYQKMDRGQIGEDGYIEGSISNLKRGEYLAFLSDRLREAKELTRTGTRLAFLMSDWDDNTGEQDGIFLWDYANIIESAGWKLTRHIQVPLSTQQVHPDIVLKFRESRRLARLERYLLIGER